MKPPTVNQIKVMRSRAGLTQKESATLTHVHWRTWSDWERGVAKMRPGLWELFQAKQKFIECGLEEA